MPAGNNIGSLSIKVTPDTHLFRSELAAALAGIDDDIHIPVKLDLDKNGIAAKVKAATAGLDETANVKVKVDERGLDKLAVFGNNFGGGGRGLGIFSSFVDNLAVAAAVASIAAPALALVTGALATLPAIVAGVAAPIAAIALGLEGIKKAAAPLSEPLNNLKTAISGVFEQRLAGPFTLLAQAMPKLAGPMGVVAHGISDVASSLINAISTGPGLANLQGTISNIGKTISVMAPGVNSLTSGLLGLANNVSAKFPKFGEWFNNAANGFANWVEKASASGELDTAMGNLGSTLKEVVDLVGDLAIKGFEFLKDPKFGETMKNFVADVRSLVNDVLPGLKNFFSDLAGAIDGAVKAIDKAKQLGNSLPDFLKGGDQPKPEPGANPFTSKNAPWRDLIGQGDDVAKGLFDPSFGASIRNWFGKTLKDEIFNPGFFEIAGKPVGPSLAKIFEGANAFLAAPIATIANTLGIGMATASAEAGTQAGANLGTKLGQGFQLATTTLGPQIDAALTGALAQLQTVPAQIQQAFAGVGAAVTGSMATVVGAVANAGSQIVAAFTGALSQIPGVATGVFSQVQAAAAAGMANVVSAITSGAAQAVAAVTSMGQQIIAAMQSAAAGAQAAGAAIGQGLAAGIRSSTGAAVAAAQAMAAAVTAASQVKLGIKSPSKVFTEIGAQTAQGLQNGLEGGFTGVIERAKALSQDLTDAVNGGLAGVDQSVLSETIKKQLDELELQRKMLKVEKDAIPKEDKEGRKGVQGQLDQLQALKDQLALQKDQLGFSQKYGDSTGENDKMQEKLGESLTKIVDIGKGFATANADQFMSDLGMSGQGAIPTIANEGLNFLTTALSGMISSGFGGMGGTTIQVNSVDQALAAKQTIDNKKALQFAGR